MILAAAIALALPTSIKGFQSGNELHDYCQTDRQACRLYTVGVVDALSAKAPFGKALVCIPHQATEGEVTDVVKQWVEQHPAERHRPAATLVEEALTGAFPCR